MASGNAQTEDVVMEAVQINGHDYMGTFGDPLMMPIMTQAGYQDYLVTPLKIAKALFTAPPASKQTIRRPLTEREFFVQMVDNTHPVVFTFILTDREV